MKSTSRPSGAIFPTPDTYQVSGRGQLPSAFAVSDMASASLAAVGVALADLIQALNLSPTRPEVTVDHRLASLWFGYSFAPAGWNMPNLWDDLAGDYETADGWIKLHTNLPRHRAAALTALGCEPDRQAVAEAASRWEGEALETAIVEAGGVAAKLRSRTEWQSHPQGRAVASEPLIGWTAPRHIKLRERPEANAERPLAGLRVIDLTRVLAGPVSTRTLAGFGAEVLRIDPPGWDEPGVIPDISLGKRCVYLDLKSRDGIDRLRELLADADVLVHGYRPGALDGLGLDLATRDRIAPNRVEVCLDAYGWTGPWAGRRGFDSLVQMSSGIAAEGRLWAGADRPTPLPVQALDHATGYLMAAALLSALATAARGEKTALSRLSLTRTAEALINWPENTSNNAPITATSTDYGAETEQSGWGPGHRLRPALSLSTTGMRWDRPAGRLGSAAATWSTD